MGLLCTVNRSPHSRTLIPNSPPARFSARRSEFAFVTTFPTRKFRYSSLRVGARKAWYTEALTATPVLKVCSNAKRGLKAVSVRHGKELAVPTPPLRGLRLEKPRLFNQLSARPPKVNSQLGAK